jgi:hypothetical protein
MTGQEFIIVVRESVEGFKYRVYLVPTGEDQRSARREYISGVDTLWGARRLIRKERRRLAVGPKIVHREAR